MVATATTAASRYRNRLFGLTWRGITTYLAVFLLGGLVFTTLLAWSAAIIFPPKGIEWLVDAERHVESDGLWYRQEITSHGMLKSPLSWACGQCTAVRGGGQPVNAYRADRGKPQHVSRSGLTDIAAIAPLSGADWLMPWLGSGKIDTRYSAQDRHLYAYGWPWLAYGQLRDFRFHEDNTIPCDISIEGALSLPAGLKFGGLAEPPMWAAWTLPVRPLWGGLILDTLFVAGVVGLAFGSVRGTRRFMRVRKSRCIHCNYDLRATPQNTPCPECGRAR